MNKHELSEREEIFIRKLREGLPPAIARKDVRHFLGGIVSPQTLANLDRVGQGPKDAYRVGIAIVYPTDSLLDWVVQHFGIAHIQNKNS